MIRRTNGVKQGWVQGKIAHNALVVKRFVLGVDNPHTGCDDNPNKKENKIDLREKGTFFIN